MIPKPPPKEGSLGFLFIPPFRVQGTSIAGETTCIQVPELDVCFDMGACPRAMLSSKYIAVSHGHMDHVGGLAYYCSQRKFQGMGTGSIICHKQLGPAIRKMMAGYVDLEGQTTPFDLIELEPEQEFQIKNNIVIRMFEVDHTTVTAGYVIVEKRSKLKPEFAELPQEKLRELKDRGEDITRILEVPLVAYLADTAPGVPLLRTDVRKAQIVIAECTFVEPDHKEKAAIGKHLHLDNIIEWAPLLEGEKLVLIHLSRRSNILQARKHLQKRLRPEQLRKIEFLMDHKFNRDRYERQAMDAERLEAARASSSTQKTPAP